MDSAVFIMVTLTKCYNVCFNIGLCSFDLFEKTAQAENVYTEPLLDFVLIRRLLQKENLRRIVDSTVER